jgi:hypothetical protein
MFGINAYLLRVLCENPWDGGAGYTPQQVAEMTPDQVYFRLCDRELLKKKKHTGRTKKMSSLQVTSMAAEKGLVRGRASDGTLIMLPLSTGKSQVQLIKERLKKQKKK